MLFTGEDPVYDNILMVNGFELRVQGKSSNKKPKIYKKFLSENPEKIKISGPNSNFVTYCTTYVEEVIELLA